MVSRSTGTMAEEENVIEVKDLVKRFGKQTVLDGINFTASKGETLVIMGGSGCGKSTLLRHMIGSIRPDSGYVTLFGEDITKMEEEQLNEVRKRFGILFQSSALFNSMSVEDNVSLPLREHTDLDESIIELQVVIKLQLVSMLPARQKMPAQLSGGMKKRAGLARALALDPEILFYDEPSAGLDPVTSAQIDQLIIDLSKRLGVTSVVVTHEMDSAFTIADRMLMLHKGKVLMQGPRSEFEELRDMPDSSGLSPEKLLIRQFLRGEAEGPLRDTAMEEEYAEALGIKE
jgi:phospholipid/cholesterol/gamma-HCH transport system ATP-binding protein